jgi:hypothetical protein
MSLSEFAASIFYDKNSPAFFSADFYREFVVAVFIYLIGWASSLRSARGRLKARIIDELVLAQRELFKRAYPETWNENATRENWMLSPFLDRISFVAFNLKQEGQLSASETRTLEAYLSLVEEFIAQWSVTKRRRSNYDDKYEAAFAALRDFLEMVAPRQVRRIDGLIVRASGNGQTASLEESASDIAEPA